MLMPPTTAPNSLLAQHRDHGWWLPLAVLVAGVSATLVLVVWSVHGNAAERRALFERRVATLRQTLDTRVQSYIDTLPGLRLVASGAQRANDADFLRYVEAISLQERFPNLALNFVADLVRDEERDAYVAAVRADRSVEAAGRPTFDIRPAGRRPRSMVLRHQYPDDRLTRGYDLYDPAQHYRSAVETAIDSAAYVATAPLLLARDRSSPRSANLVAIVVRAATYEGGVIPTTVAQRRARATGVVGISVGAAKLVGGALPDGLAASARVRIVDTAALAAGAPAVVFDSQPEADAKPGSANYAMQVADRLWQLELTPRPLPLLGDADETTWALLVAGLVSALSLAAMTRALTRANRVAEGKISEGLARLQAEKVQLADSESRFRMLFANSFDAVLRTRPDGCILAANPAACAIFGLSEAELQASDRLRFVDPADPRLAELLARRLADGRAQGRITMRRGDGAHFEAELSSMLYADGQGQPTASLIVRDLSSEIQAAAERHRLEEQLRHAQKMEAVGTLAGGIAHDFNNVLAVVLGNAAIAAHDIGTQHPAAPSLDRIRQASQRGRSLVQQLLTFSRPPLEHLRVQLLRPLVEEALTLLRATLPATARLDLHLSDAPMPVLTDPTQIQQVLMNLCSNAWQALPAQGGCIEVSLVVISVASVAGDAAPAPHARLRVRDDGAGMDTATRNRIFEPFFTTKKAGHGTGLGLAMVHGIVSAHGGRIAVDSELGHGTTVDVLLPLQAVPGPQAGGADGAAGAAAAAVPRGRSQRVMVIDDDEVVALTVEALLLRLGYRVVTFSNPEAAMHTLAADPLCVDLVMTDFNMPQMTGLDVAVAVRRLRADLPVLITSGNVSDELLVQAQSMGVMRVMLKEYIAEQIGGAVADLLAGTVQADPDTPT